MTGAVLSSTHRPRPATILYNANPRNGGHIDAENRQDPPQPPRDFREVIGDGGKNDADQKDRQSAGVDARHLAFVLVETEVEGREPRIHRVVNSLNVGLQLGPRLADLDGECIESALDLGNVLVKRLDAFVNRRIGVPGGSCRRNRSGALRPGDAGGGGDLMGGTVPTREKQRGHGVAGPAGLAADPVLGRPQ